MAAAPSMTADTSKMSFAKVAAIAGKENVALISSPRTLTSMSQEVIDSATSLSAKQNLSTTDNTTSNNSKRCIDDSPTRTNSNMENSESSLVEAVKALHMHDLMPSLVVNGSGVVGDSGPGTAADDSPDDNFQRVDSSSESGTKPPSLDGKSITSGTTFALDERESLRPDDSASVKAAEDDDTFSARGSIIAGSRIGSEAAALYRNNQFYEPSERRATITSQDLLMAGTRTPHSGSSGQQILDEAKPQDPLRQIGESDEAHSLFYKQTPDEKLIEALESPKDRLFLLRLEQQVMEFVKDSKEPFIDLPPSNSFCRMLTHKLADYYHLTHQVDPVANFVRIFRTPFCRIPRSLTSITPPTTGNTPPPTVPAMKIMRRGEENGTSMSKATSENGSDGKDKTSSAKDKCDSLSNVEKITLTPTRAQLTREEREAQYAIARERIFGKDSEKAGEATPETEKSDNDMDMSRSSSVSNKDKSGKRSRGKQRREDSESFDARSQYKAYYPTPQQQQPAWTPSPQLVNNNLNMAASPRNGAPMANNSYQPIPYVPMTQQQYQNPMMGGGAMQYNQMGQVCAIADNSGYPQQFDSNIYQQFPQQQQQQSMQQNMHPQYHSSPMQNYSQPMPNMPQAPQLSAPWQQNMQPNMQQNMQQSIYQNTYQGQAQQQMPQHSRGPSNVGPPIPYPYGQLPSTANPADPKSQHPIPGSFNRSAFNPKTQSFIPNNGGRPTQQQVVSQQSMHQQPMQSMHQQSMYQQQMYHQPISQHGSPRLNYNGYAPPNPQYSGGSMGYGMARQGSNNSLPSYHASPQIPNRPMVQQNMHQNLPANLPPNPGLAHHMSANGINGSHLPQYGNAANLPPKPPPAM